MTTTAGLTENNQVTSQATTFASGPSTESLRERTYEHVLSMGKEGATDEVVASALAMNPLTQRPRRDVLFNKGKFADGLRTRLTRSGRCTVGARYEDAR